MGVVGVVPPVAVPVPVGTTGGTTGGRMGGTGTTGAFWTFSGAGGVRWADVIVVGIGDGVIAGGGMRFNPEAKLMGAGTVFADTLFKAGFRFNPDAKFRGWGLGLGYIN